MMRCLLSQQLIHDVHFAALGIEGHQAQTIKDLLIGILFFLLGVRRAIILLAWIDILPGSAFRTAGVRVAVFVFSVLNQE